MFIQYPLVVPVNDSFANTARVEKGATEKMNGIARLVRTLYSLSLSLSRTLLNERCRRNELDNNKLTKK
jgi:hypothetical protein